MSSAIAADSWELALCMTHYNWKQAVVLNECFLLVFKHSFNLERAALLTYLPGLTVWGQAVNKYRMIEYGNVCMYDLGLCLKNVMSIECQNHYKWSE